MALIRANRESIDDRFSVLGFTVRTELPLFEIGLATHPDLLKPENRDKRNPHNFFSSHVLAAAAPRNGRASRDAREAVYLVPPNVVARFVGQPRLYFGLATYQENDRSRPFAVKIPDAGNMYVSMSGLTERGLRRTSRGNGPIGYGNGGNGQLSWGGDTLIASAKANGNGAAAAAPANGPAPYSDGYSDDLWQQPADTTAPAAANNGAAPGDTTTATAPATTAQNLRTSARRGGQAPVRSQRVVSSHYRPTGLWDALTTQAGFFLESAMWWLGVVDTTVPPHSAICQVRTSADQEHGSAFFIGPRLLLTAAHVVHGQSELIVVPAKNASSEPAGRFRVSASDWQMHPSYVPGGNGDFDMALIRVPAANAASAGNYFDLVEELTQSRPEGVVVCGYAAYSDPQDGVDRFVNDTIDPNKQHMMGGYIRTLPTDETFDYDLQTLGGTSGAPVYWIEQGDQPRAHMVGVHIASHSATTNLGCRITPAKTQWIRSTASAWGQTLTFSLAARSLNETTESIDPDAIGIGENEPVEAAVAAAQSFRGASRPRTLTTETPDYPGASRFAPAHANNYTRGRRADRVLDRIVIHITAGGPNINGTIGWFQNGNRINPRTGKPIRSSAHYIVGRDGEVVQMVHDADTAHHASQANSRSIGIEHNANKPTPDNTLDLPPTPEQYEASARLVAWLCQRHGITADREHIRGHFEISPRDDHDCPSSYWDWDYYMACVQRAVSELAASAVPAAQSLRTGVPARRPLPSYAQDAAALDRFVWPSGMSEGNYLVKAYIDAYNSAGSGDSERAGRDRQTLLSLLTRDLQSAGDRGAISEAILMITTAVSMQVFDHIKDRLPASMYYMSFDPNDPAFSQDVNVPHALTVLSRRIGGFMAHLDLAVQRASADEAVRIALQKEEWERISGAVGMLTTAIGMVPGLGTAASIAVNLISMGVTSLVGALAPDFDQRHASFEAAMQAVRNTYKQLSATVLEALVKAKLAPDMTLTPMGNPLHPVVAKLLDAHAAYALLGWQEQLVALGVPSPATALSANPRRYVVSRAQEIITPYYDPSNPSTALMCTQDAFSQAKEEWFVGVSDTRSFPHAAICQLNMTAPDGSQYGGTGFYIGPNRILTCAHNLHGMSSCEIIPGRNGAGNRPFGSATVSSSSWRVAPRYTGDGDWDNDLAVIDNVPIAAPGGQYFRLLNATPSTQLPVAVCGYSAASRAVPGLTDIIDGDKQHLHGGYVSAAPTADTIDYPILSLMGASGSPVYTLTGSGNDLQAKICAVHVSGEPAAHGLNRGCFITPAKIDWIEGRATSFALGAPARALIIGPEDVERAQRYAPQWADLFNWQAPGSVDAALAGRGMRVQRIQDAIGELNLDRYEVRCTALPSGWSAEQMLEHVRLHLNDFVDTDNSEFIPYAPGTDDVAWASSSPVGAVFKIDIVGPDNASVVGSLVEPRRWRFTTINAPWSGDHPVSGHREFGVRDDNGASVFYTRGADRSTQGAGETLVFAGAHHLWLSFQRKLTEWINNNGGSATAPAPFSERFHPEVVRILYGTAQSLGMSQTVRALEGEVPSDYPVHLIPQPDKNACWCAAMAMLLSYRRQQSFTPETLANQVGASLATCYDWNLIEAVKARYGFEVIRQPSNASIYHSPRQWASWLRAYGPLWVVIVGAPHAVVLGGIRGDLDNPAAVQVKILNPWDTRVAFDSDPVAFNPANNGYEDWLPFEQFASDFGNMAEPDYGNWRVLHLPLTATTAQALSAGGIRLKPEPNAIRISRTFNADAAGESREPIEPTRVAGTRMSVLRGRAGANRWALDQLEGMKPPVSLVSGVSSTAAPAETVINLGEWPAVEGQTSPLPLTVRFRSQQGSVGDVSISAVPGTLTYGVDVVARIEDDADVAGVAAIKVGIDYRFNGLAQGSPSARIELRLLGDGRYERENRWLTTAVAA